MNRELLEALVQADAALQRAHRIAVDSNRPDIVEEIDCAKVDVCDAIAIVNPNKTVVELCS